MAEEFAGRFGVLRMEPEGRVGSFGLRMVVTLGNSLIGGYEEEKREDLHHRFRLRADVLRILLFTIHGRSQYMVLLHPTIITFLVWLSLTTRSRKSSDSSNNLE